VQTDRPENPKLEYGALQGVAWFSGRTLIPAVAGLEKPTINEPLRLPQPLSIDDPEEARVVLERFKLVHPDIKGFCSAGRAIVAGLPTPKGSPPWDTVIVKGQRYVLGGLCTPWQTDPAHL